MKNIHILPTDKPSRLYTNRYGEYKLHADLYTMPLDSIGSNQNIYIISDEEIKDGDWMIRDNEQPIKVTKDFFWDFGVRYYKIILTTDGDLINDGIQAIDDAFLEWFVKNPSCEEVEVELQIKSVQLPQKQLSENSYDLSFRWIDVTYYKIIIPNEEPKQETPEQHIERINEVIDKFDATLTKFKEKQKEILIEMMRDDAEAGLYNDSERRYSEDELKRAHWNGWVERERLDDMVPELDYPPGLDYEEKEEYAFNEFLKRLNNGR